jgi:hypothetical protein
MSVGVGVGVLVGVAVGVLVGVLVGVGVGVGVSVGVGVGVSVGVLVGVKVGVNVTVGDAVATLKEVEGRLSVVVASESVLLYCRVMPNGPRAPSLLPEITAASPAGHRARSGDMLDAAAAGEMASLFTRSRIRNIKMREHQATTRMRFDSNGRWLVFNCEPPSTQARHAVGPSTRSGRTLPK